MRAIYAPALVEPPLVASNPPASIEGWQPVYREAEGYRLTWPRWSNDLICEPAWVPAPPLLSTVWLPVYEGKQRDRVLRPWTSHEIHAAPPSLTPSSTTPDQWSPVVVEMIPARRKALLVTQDYVTSPPASALLLLAHVWCACVGQVAVAGAVAGVVIVTGAVAGDVIGAGGVAGQAGCC